MTPPRSIGADLQQLALDHLQRGIIADPADPTELLTILRTLYATGRRDLPLARLLEGHVDAVQIVWRHATDTQRAQLRQSLCARATLGVWNAPLPDENLILEDFRLTGGKAFASGAGILSHALVTAAQDERMQLVLLDLDRTPPKIDRDWWKTTGMQRSETHLVRWHAAEVEAADCVGGPDVYASEPFFSSGALRFVAVHAGGIAGLFDHVRGHLFATGRASDPHQTVRLADLLLLAQGAASAVRNAAAAWFGEKDETRIAQVISARLAVSAAADSAITLAQQSVGVQALFLDNPLSALISDLAVYLRQPAPDAQKMRLGTAAAAGVLAPGL